MKIFEIFLIQNKELRRSSRQFGELLVPILAGVLGYETAQTFQNKPSESQNENNDNFEQIERYLNTI